MLVEVTAPPATQERERPPVNLAFVIDRSGSMSGQKLELAKTAVIEAIGRLDAARPVQRRHLRRRGPLMIERDRGAGSAERRRDARSRHRTGWQHEPVGRLVRRLRAGRDAARGRCRQPLPAPDRRPGQRRHHRSRRADRARRRASRPRRLDDDVRRRGRLRRVLLQAMSDAGGGHFYYIADTAQIRDHIASEVGETLEVDGT